MSHVCVRESEVFHLLDGELTANEERRLRAEVASCAACRGKLSSMEQMIVDLGAPLSGVPRSGAAARVLARLDEPASRTVPSVAARWVLGALGGAAAAAVLFAIVRPTSFSGGDFHARGYTGKRTIAQDVGIRLYAPIESGQPVRAGARLSSATPLTATYQSVRSGRSLYLMMFAIDAVNQVHWLYPGYLDAKTDPVSLLLPASAGETPLRESVVLEHAAPGRLRVVSLVSTAELHVSAIEALPEAELTRAALEHRFVDSAVQELDLIVSTETEYR